MLCTAGEAGGAAILPRVDQPNVPASTITHTANQIALTLPSFAAETSARGLKEFTLRVKPRRQSGYCVERAGIQLLTTI
jgi:hypothetical protein